MSKISSCHLPKRNAQALSEIERLGIEDLRLLVLA